MDPKACLDILSQRTPQDMTELQQSAAATAPVSGQVIDLATGTVSGRAEDSGAAMSPPPAEASGAMPPPPPSDDASELDALDARALATRFQSLQQQRVRAYKQYDDGLEAILRDEQLAAYPALVTEATARFASLSRDINTVEERLLLRRADDDPARDAFARRAAELIRRVQQLEKEKLELTAATHLERIRETQVAADAAPLSASNLEYMRRRQREVVDAINEQLDELRCELVDD